MLNSLDLETSEGVLRRLDPVVCNIWDTEHPARGFVTTTLSLFPLLWRGISVDVDRIGLKVEASGVDGYKDSKVDREIVISIKSPHVVDDVRNNIIRWFRRGLCVSEG